MFNSKSFVFLLLISSLFHQRSNGYVTIQIEPEDLQRFADIIVQVSDIPIVIRSSTSTSSKMTCILSSLKSLSRGVLQMTGILLTLVGANLLTTKLEPYVENRYSVLHSQSVHVKNITTSTPTPNLCQHDYGCDEHLCWRTCGGTNEEEEINNETWCYTSPMAKTEKTKYQKCNLANECSPCWECLSPCMSKDFI